MNKTKKKLRTYRDSGQQISCITCYDSSFSKILSDANIDIILVGDSLGMVIKGETNTHSVNMEEIIYHTRCVSKNKKNSILMVDMPINSYSDSVNALKNAKAILENKGDIIKIEYKDEHQDILKQLISQEIPVCAHLGYLPQFSSSKKDIKIYGKDTEERSKILSQAKILDDMQVDLLLLECVDPNLAIEITKSTKAPVIGIGSGDKCNGQVQVLYDILGISENAPKFSTNFLKECRTIEEAVAEFKNYVSNLKIN